MPAAIEVHEDPMSAIQEPGWRMAATVLTRALEVKHPYTHGHSARVQRMAVWTARALGWDAGRISGISTAAVLHDCGKLAVEGATLNNQTPFLTAEQHHELVDHPYAGARMVAGLVSNDVLLGILQHHERMDGKTSGVPYPAYPFGIPGEQIHLFARVITVCDTWDAMTTRRSYNIPFSVVEATRILLQGAGSRHDETIVKIFLEQVLQKIPWGK